MFRLKFAGAIAAGVLVTSCSFPASGVVVGTITHLSVKGYFGTNVPVTIRARATFPGAIDHASLTTDVSARSGNTIRVMATASRAQHFLGLGVFPVDTSSPNNTEIETTVSVSSPGVYVIEGLQDGAVTASTSFSI